MNYYERIQQAVDYAEAHLSEPLRVKTLAQQAYLSVPSLYRLFFAVTGYSVQEYVRQRRLACAADTLRTGGATVLDTALEWGFSGAESFTRAFKRAFGVPPSVYRRQPFARPGLAAIDVLKHYFMEEPNMTEDYPDIKVLRELPPVRVVTVCADGPDPETAAFSILQNWYEHSGLNVQRDALRIYGHDDPCPTPENPAYGYRVYLTVPDTLTVTGDEVQAGTLPGGLYVVCAVPDLTKENPGTTIPAAWKRLCKWIEQSRYEADVTRPGLEEHLEFDGSLNHLNGMDLYMPIKGGQAHGTDL
ncbi:MAG: AraC family transcriptional regulator [Oscillospiraceae bacterium]|nr:AraC family transcriptional regulator [Oscillospiraceae bacterium]